MQTSQKKKKKKKKKKKTPRMEGKAQCTIAISFLTKNVTFSMGRHCAYMKASSM
jgi:hypothetical protein